jgi:phosphatidylinositol glycan class M
VSLALHLTDGYSYLCMRLLSPYRRETYRYTPLLALLLAPNEWVHPAFGKILFSAADLIAGILIRQILLHNILPYGNASRAASSKDAPVSKVSDTASERQATMLSAIHLLNPMVFAISTRGSSEALLLLLVLFALRSATRGAWTSAAIWIGVATHWKIYPVIYGVACVSALSPQSGSPLALVNARTVRFGLVAAATFFALGAACYAGWGQPFVEEAYLYHLGRRDHRHNFAPHFYPAYLASAAADGLAGLLRSPLVAFLPQMSAALGAGILFGRKPQDMPFAWFVQTVCFVLFNKVCTSQASDLYLLGRTSC